MIGSNVRITAAYKVMPSQQVSPNKITEVDPDELLFNLDTGTLVYCEKPISLAELQRRETSFIV